MLRLEHCPRMPVQNSRQQAHMFGMQEVRPWRSALLLPREGVNLGLRSELTCGILSSTHRDFLADTLLWCLVCARASLLGFVLSCRRTHH